MSKQSEAKERQGYTPKAVPQTCGNCAHFACERVQVHPPSPSIPSGWWEDKDLRCGIGGFAVKKMGTCNEFAGTERP